MEYRIVEIIELEKFIPALFNSLKNLVIKTIVNKSDTYLDIGSLCYLRKTKVNKYEHQAKVDKNSYESVIDQILLKYFDNNYHKNQNPDTLRTNYSLLNCLIKDLEKNGLNFDFSTEEKAKELYIIYSNYLKEEEKRIFRDTERESNAILSRKQHILAELISSYHDIEISKVKSCSSDITYKSNRNQRIKAVSKNEISNFFKLNMNIYNSLKVFLMQEGLFPVRIMLNEKKCIYTYFFKEFKGIGCSYVFKRNGIIKNKENVNKIKFYFLKNKDINKKYGTRKISDCIHDTFNEYDLIIKKINSEPLNYERKAAINFAIASFAMAFICNTGCNPSIIYDLNIQDLELLDNSVKNMKVLKVKNRAGNKAIKVNITKKFITDLKKYVEFRKYLVDKYEIENYGLFFSWNVNNNKNHEVVNFSHNSLIVYKRWFLKFIETREINVNWIKPSLIRLSVSNIFLEKTNSNIIASNKLGNTPNVININYSDVVEGQVEQQFNDFFERIYNKAVYSNRINTKDIDVKIDNDNCVNTPMGACGLAEPSIKKGFKNEIIPTCSNPVTCLFCENYVIKSDDTDIRKILSLLYITRFFDKNFNDLVHIKFRIKEILDAIIKLNIKNKSKILSIGKEVEEGYLDEYWEENYLNFFINISE